MTPAQVAIRVEVEAEKLGLERYPSHMTVYRVLNPIIERKEQKQKLEILVGVGRVYRIKLVLD